MAVDYAAKRRAPAPLEWHQKQKALKKWEKDFPSRREETREKMDKIVKDKNKLRLEVLR